MLLPWGSSEGNSLGHRSIWTMLLEPGGKANGKPATPPPPPHANSQAKLSIDFGGQFYFCLWMKCPQGVMRWPPGAEEGLGSTCFLIVASSGSERGP